MRAALVLLALFGACSEEQAREPADPAAWDGVYLAEDTTANWEHRILLGSGFPESLREECECEVIIQSEYRSLGESAWCIGWQDYSTGVWEDGIDFTTGSISGVPMGRIEGTVRDMSFAAAP